LAGPALLVVIVSSSTRSDLMPVAEQLRRALDNALATVEWVSGFEFPDLELDHEMLALSQPGRYPIENGTIARSTGPSFPVADFTEHVVESQVPHSTALHATLDGGCHLTGPLARYSLNSSALSPLAAQSAARAGLSDECRNPFRSIIVRAVEVVYAIEEALRIIGEYQRPSRPFVDVPVRAGTGHGVSEAPRGLALSPIPDRRGRAGFRGDDNPADFAEPGRHRSRPGSGSCRQSVSR
jgi:sulfhydrogenase subunit alpha